MGTKGCKSSTNLKIYQGLLNGRTSAVHNTCSSEIRSPGGSLVLADFRAPRRRKVRLCEAHQVLLYSEALLIAASWKAEACFLVWLMSGDEVYTCSSWPNHFSRRHGGGCFQQVRSRGFSPMFSPALEGSFTHSCPGICSAPLSGPVLGSLASLLLLLLPSQAIV